MYHYNGPQSKHMRNMTLSHLTKKRKNFAMKCPRVSRRRQWHRAASSQNKWWDFTPSMAFNLCYVHNLFNIVITCVLRSNNEKQQQHNLMTLQGSWAGIEMKMKKKKNNKKQIGMRRGQSAHSRAHTMKEKRGVKSQQMHMLTKKKRKIEWVFLACNTVTITAWHIMI